jgi:hypothetical protein
MEFKDIVSITGMPGLYSMDTQKANGCIVTSLNDGKTNFVSSRKHLFTMLDNIAIYTDKDSEELIRVFVKMKENAEATPIAEANASADELKAFLEATLPDYDRERVYVSDIRKMIKWFTILDEKGLIDQEKKRLEEEDASSEAAEAEKESES